MEIKTRIKRVLGSASAAFVLLVLFQNCEVPQEQWDLYDRPGIVCTKQYVSSHMDLSLKEAELSLDLSEYPILKAEVSTTSSNYKLDPCDQANSASLNSYVDSGKSFGGTGISIVETDEGLNFYFSLEPGYILESKKELVALTGEIQAKPEIEVSIVVKKSCEATEEVEILTKQTAKVRLELDEPEDPCPSGAVQIYGELN